MSALTNAVMNSFVNVSANSSVNVSAPKAGRVDVFCDLRGTRYFVGKLAHFGKSIYFEYNQDFLSSGIELSPFKLPLQSGIFENKECGPGGLFGLFNDSLPEDWGKALLGSGSHDKILRLDEISPVQRLAMVGASGRGALEYVAQIPKFNSKTSDFMKCGGLAEDVRRILQEAECPLDSLNELFRSRGASRGGKPTLPVDVCEDSAEVLPVGAGEVGSSPWLIKFHSREGGRDQGLVEYMYSLMAKDAGVEMPETRLFSSKTTGGFFGVARFDRDRGQKVHVQTACGLLHADRYQASLSYEHLIKLTKVLTGDVREVEKMIRLMVFNVKAGNLDDHSRKFSFLLDSQNHWKMAPACDLLPAVGFGGKHVTKVNGKCMGITNADLMAAASVADIKSSLVREVILRTEETFSSF